MEKPFMCLLMSEVIEAIVKGRRKNDCSFLFGVCHSDVNRYGIFHFISIRVISVI